MQTKIRQEGNVIHADFKPAMEICRMSMKVLYANEDIVLLECLTEINGVTTREYQTHLWNQPQADTPPAA